MTSLATIRAKLREILAEDEQIEEGWGTNLMTGMAALGFLSFAALEGTLLYASFKYPPSATAPDQYCIDQHGHVVLFDYPADREQSPRPETVRASVYNRSGHVGGTRENVAGDQLIPIFYVGNDLFVINQVNGAMATAVNMKTGETQTLPAEHLRPLVDGQLSAYRWNILDNFTAQMGNQAQ